MQSTSEEYSISYYGLSQQLRPRPSSHDCTDVELPTCAFGRSYSHLQDLGKPAETPLNGRQIKVVFHFTTSLAVEQDVQINHMHLKTTVSALSSSYDTFSCDASEAVGGVDDDVAVDNKRKRREDAPNLWRTSEVARPGEVNLVAMICSFSCCSRMHVGSA